jgi:hypothetical protein
LPSHSSQFSTETEFRPIARFESATGNLHPILSTPEHPLSAGDQEWRCPAVARAPCERLEAIAQRTLSNKFLSSKRPATGMTKRLIGENFRWPRPGGEIDPVGGMRIGFVHWGEDADALYGEPAEAGRD